MASKLLDVSNLHNADKKYLCDDLLAINFHINLRFLSDNNVMLI